MKKVFAMLVALSLVVASVTMSVFAADVGSNETTIDNVSLGQIQDIFVDYLDEKGLPLEPGTAEYYNYVLEQLLDHSDTDLCDHDNYDLIHAYMVEYKLAYEIELFDGTFNFTPIVFKIISGELTLGSWVKTMLAGNFLMFIPMGFFLPLAASKMDFKKILKIAIVVPIIVEIIQPIVGRSFDIDDIILNFAGIMIGYWFVVCIIKLSKKRLFGK